MKTLSVIGGGAVDEYYRCDRWIDLGDKAIVTSGGRRIGGTTFNAAAVAAALGLSTRMLDVMNLAEADGRFVYENMKEYSLDCTCVIDDPDAVNSKALIILTKDGERGIFVQVASRPFKPYLEGWADVLASSDYIYSMVTTVGTFIGAQDALKKAREGGALVCLDCDARYELGLEIQLAKLCDYPIFNAFSYDVFANAAGAETAKLLLRGGARAVIETRDSEGVRVHTASETRDFPAYKVAVADTTGAGDTFSGAFLSALARGADAFEAAQFANAAAARSVMFVGATGGVCSRGEVERFMGEY